MGIRKALRRSPSQQPQLAEKNYIDLIQSTAVSLADGPFWIILDRVAAACSGWGFGSEVEEAPK